MSNGRTETRFTDVKRTFPKPINLSSQVLLDRERCVLCARCTRFSNQIAGDPFIELLERGALQQVGIAAGEPFDSISAVTPFRSVRSGADRLWRTGSEHGRSIWCRTPACANTARQVAPAHRSPSWDSAPRLAGDDADVNEEWNCDKGRWAFKYTTVGDRISTRSSANGELRPASWSRPSRLRPKASETVRPGASGRQNHFEDAYAYSKFTPNRIAQQ